MITLPYIRIPKPDFALLLVAFALKAFALQATVLPSAQAFDGGSEPSRVDELYILPSKLSVTPDYPGSFAIWSKTADGLSTEISHDPSVIVRTVAPSIAVIREEVVSAVAPGRTELLVEWKGRTASVDIVSESDSQLFFSREVIATITRSGCNLGTCHGNLHGKGGLRLSLRGDDPEFDHQRLAFEYGQRRVDIWDPDSSLLLRKATGTTSHQGGKRFGLEDPEYTFLRRWISEGAPRNVGPDLVALMVQPSLIRVESGQRTARIVVQAKFSDGSIRDVTRWSRIEPSQPSGVSISKEGWIVADRPMDVSFGVTYLSGRAGARVIFLGESKSTISNEFIADNPVDRLVLSQCRQLQLTPLERADDWTLIRRLYLVTVARLPTTEEVLAFVNDSDPMRVTRAVDRLLADPSFDYAWAMRWSDLIRNEDKVMSSRGAGLLHDWLRQQSAADRSIRSWIAEMLSSVGSTYDNPPASFHRTHRDPFVAAESTAQVFLGVRMQCAKCHNHPFDVWRQDDYYGMAAYFSTIERKQIDNKPKDELDKHIITGDEIISLAERAAEIKHPGRSKMVGPSPLAARGQATGISAGPSIASTSGNVLQQFAAWLTENNSQFDANIANRVWFQYFGRGIVDPPDDFRDSNPPSNPELLQFLATTLRDSDYSIKSLSRVILTSEAFARRSSSDIEELDQLSPIPYFAGYPVRRLAAEVLMDAISDATGVPSQFRSGSDENAMPVARAMHMPGIPKKKGFLTTFGKPERLLVCECERSSQVSLGQSLAMVNGKEIREKLTENNNVIDQLLRSGNDVAAIVDQLFLTALCRPPTDRERAAAIELLDSSSDRPQTVDEVVLAVKQGLSAPMYRKRRVLEDILWALLNSKEFIMLR